MRHSNRMIILAMWVAGLSLASGTVQAYNLMGFDWNYLGGSPVTVNFYINPNCTDPTAPDELGACQSALNTWNNAGADFAFNYAGLSYYTASAYNGQNTVCWNPGSSGGALATATSWYIGVNMLEADVEFWDAPWVWNTTWPTGSQFDVESVGLHEMGHTLGLDHSQYSQAVMWPYISYGEVHRALHQDDINGIIAIYGAVIIPSLDVSMTPLGMPIMIPPGGGRFEYIGSVHNTTGSVINFDIWTGLILPNGYNYGPLFRANGINIGAGASFSRRMRQNVPWYAPPGVYTHYCKVGSYPSMVIDEDSFEFSKSASDDGNPNTNNWTTEGWDFGEESSSEQPASIILHSPQPNPFNQKTDIRYQLQAASYIKLAVFDISGREVVSLAEGWYPAGTHNVELDAAAISSGVYLTRLEADGTVCAQKLLLVK